MRRGSACRESAVEDRVDSFPTEPRCLARDKDAVVAGWALAQWPTILPGLDVRHAAAPHDTLVAVVVAVLGGGAIVFPSLALLFRLAQPTVSMHVKVLRESGLVRSERQGGRMRLSADAAAVELLLGELRQAVLQDAAAFSAPVPGPAAAT